MSKLAKSLSVTTTQKQVPLSRDIFLYKEDFTSHSGYKATICKVTATFGCEMVIRTPEHSSEALRVIKRRVIEEVFGEFRPLIRGLEVAIYNQNNEQALEKLRELEKEMFE